MRESAANPERQYKVCVVTFPLSSNAIYTLLFDLLTVLNPLCSELVVISGMIPAAKHLSSKLRIIDIGDKMPTKITKPPCLATATLIVRNLIIQLKLSWAFFKTVKNVDVAIFFIGVPYLLIPMIIAKIRGTKVVWY